MKKYILVKYWKYGTKYGKVESYMDDKYPVVSVDNLNKQHLLDLKNRLCEAIIENEKQTN